VNAAAPGLLVVSHGRLAAELRNALLRIIDAGASVAAVSIGWDDDTETARERIRQGIDSVNGGGGVVILTDMFGGTPANLALTFCESDRVEVVTGVNLPMLIKFTNLRASMTPRELAEELAERGRRAIQVASGLLERRPAASEGDP
jgi:PTS system mannose-specific IIA component